MYIISVSSISNTIFTNFQMFLKIYIFTKQTYDCIKNMEADQQEIIIIYGTVKKAQKKLRFFSLQSQFKDHQQYLLIIVVKNSEMKKE
ncbi:hypothetical protein pb186bvf_008033 [Paramecium bursaria]